MSRQLQRQVERLTADCAAAQNVVNSLHEEAALSRIEAGERRWADFKRTLQPRLPEWRTELLGWLPARVLQRGKGVQPERPRELLEELAAHVPDESLSPACQVLVARCLTDWRSDDFEEAMAWAQVRLMIGPKGGDRLRQTCWRPVTDGWRLSDEVGVAVAATNRSDPTSAYDLLSSEMRAPDGQLGRVAVRAGAVLRFVEGA